MTCLKSGPRGEITLPVKLCERHGIAGDTPIRVIETRNGILLVPLSQEPMSPALAKELDDWQSLAADSWKNSEYLNDAP